MSYDKSKMMKLVWEKVSCRSDFSKVMKQVWAEEKAKRPSTTTPKKQKSNQKKYELETYEYARGGFHDELILLSWTDSTKKQLAADYANKSYKERRRPGKQNDLTFTGEADAAFRLNYKGRPQFDWETKEQIEAMMARAQSISGNTFAWKDWIRDMGFKWDGGAKAWVKKG